MDPNAPSTRPSLLAAPSGSPAHERMLDTAPPRRPLHRALARLGPWWVAAVLLAAVGMVALALRPARPTPAAGATPVQPLAVAVPASAAARVETVVPAAEAPTSQAVVPAPAASNPLPSAVVAAASPLPRKPGVRATSRVQTKATSRSAVKTARAKRAAPPRMATGPVRPAAAAAPRTTADPDAQLIGALMAHLERSNAASAPQARCTGQARPAGCAP